MTQSLLNQGKEKDYQDNLNANPKWICAEEFRARPENVSGLPRMELAREKCGSEEFLVVFDADNNWFWRRDNCQTYTSGALEIRIVEIE